MRPLLPHAQRLPHAPHARLEPGAAAPPAQQLPAPKLSTIEDDLSTALRQHVDALGGMARQIRQILAEADGSSSAQPAAAAASGSQAPQQAEGTGRRRDPAASAYSLGEFNEEVVQDIQLV